MAVAALSGGKYWLITRIFTADLSFGSAWNVCSCRDMSSLGDDACIANDDVILDDNVFFNDDLISNDYVFADAHFRHGRSLPQIDFL